MNYSIIVLIHLCYDLESRAGGGEGMIYLVR